MNNEEQYKFGIQSEDKLFVKLQQIYPDLCRTLGKYNHFDFEDSKTKIELKTRKITSTRYNDTLIGQNKLDAAKKLLDNYEVLFMFQFTDCLLVHKVSKDDSFKTVTLYNKPNCLIPIKDMTLLKLD